MPTSAKVRRIGFVGCGLMGEPMAARLIEAGYELAMYSRTPGKADRLAALGARLVETPAEAARDAQVVITIVGGPDDVMDVYLGGDGLVMGAAPGTWLIDMTTSSPVLAREIHDAAEVEGLHAFDAPVTGGVEGARAGTLTVFCGAADADLDHVRPVLEHLGDNLVALGEAGAGQMAKLANQVALAGSLMGMAEGLAFAKQGGLDPQVVLPALLTGTGASAAMAALGPRLVAGDLEGGAKVRLLAKDLALALEVAGDEELTLPGAQAAGELYALLTRIGGAELGAQALGMVYEDEASCAAQGLDWSLLDKPDDDDGDACGCGHHHDHEGA